MNMLSAKKVRQHGMTSSHWTTRDKLTQYKGLINLYTRDRKILSFDVAVARKKQVRELKQLRKDIKLNRTDLENAVFGDRQQLRNTLAEHRDLQLAFQNLPPIRVIDHLHQGNFNKRKLLDRMAYRMKQKTQILINLKLELAELEDGLKYEYLGQIPVEQEAQVITGKVQDAILKKEAALVVRDTYRSILDILKKDAVYFDAILGTLRMDGFLQSKCMVRTTELGQLATEYLDDRKQEFKELERAVKRDMKAREISLRFVREEVEQLTQNMLLLISRDSDINIGKVIVPRSPDDFALEKDIADISKILKFLQDTTFVSNFDAIIPCLLEQQRQCDRLKSFLITQLADRDNLLNKKQHAYMMYNSLLYTMHETTFEYKSEKKRLLSEIDEQKKRQKDMKETNLRKCSLLVNIRSALQQLLMKTSIIKAKGEKTSEKESAGRREEGGKLKKPASFSLPPSVAEDGLKILSQLEPKLQTLVTNTITPALEGEAKEQAYKFFYNLTTEICSAIDYDDYQTEESLVTEIALEDSQVPTYYDIKAKSKELVELSTVNEDLVPMFTPKKKKKIKL